MTEFLAHLISAPLGFFGFLLLKIEAWATEQQVLVMKSPKSMPELPDGFGTSQVHHVKHIETFMCPECEPTHANAQRMEIDVTLPHPVAQSLVRGNGVLWVGFANEEDE